MPHDEDELIPLKEACRLLGGFHTATYRRGAAAGRFPPILHPSPQITRVSKREVIETRERIIHGGAVPAGDADV